MLRLTVKEARDIPKMDLIGKADPYCLIQCSNNKKIYRTKTKKKTYNPVWNETIELLINNPDVDVVYIMLKDEDMGKKDDPISKCTLYLNRDPVRQVIDRWLDMTPAPGVKKGGKLNVSYVIEYDKPVGYSVTNGNTVSFNYGYNNSMSGAVSRPTVPYNTQYNTQCNNYRPYQQFNPQPVMQPGTQYNTQATYQTNQVTHGATPYVPPSYQSIYGTNTFNPYPTNYQANYPSNYPPTQPLYAPPPQNLRPSQFMYQSNNFNSSSYSPSYPSY